MLSVKEVTTILVFWNKAFRLKLVDDNTDIDIIPIVKTIKKECSERGGDLLTKTHVERRFLEDDSEACNDLPLNLIAELSPKLDDTNINR